MHMCKNQPQILNKNEWFVPKLLQQAGKVDLNGETALCGLFHSDNLSIIDQ